MPDETDLSMTLSDLSVDPWRLPEPQPTNLIALWSGPRPLDQEQAIAALSTALHQSVDVRGAASPDESSIDWLITLRAEEHPFPLTVWSEPMRPMKPEHLKLLNAESCKWVIGLETVLDPDDPLAHFVKLLRVLVAAFPESPAILDVNKEGWHTRQELVEVILCEDAEPDESLLWFTHGVCPDPQPNEHSKAWVYTQGLHRCGLPELEMVDVPFPYVGSVMHTLITTAGLILERGLPRPRTPFEIGSDLEVALIPWQEVAPHVSGESPGGADHRENHNGEPMTGAHAVVCASEPVGVDGRRWVWPEEVVARIAEGAAAIYRTKRATRQQAHRARETWPDFADAFALARTIDQNDPTCDSVTFFVKVGFHPSGGGNAHEPFDREHLWFEVQGIDGGRARARLIHKPAMIPHLKAGEVITIDSGQLSDWEVRVGLRPFGPQQAPELREALARRRKE